MQCQSRLPFRDWILPEQASSAEPLDIPPPLYAQGDGFQFSLNPLLTDPEDDFSIDPRTAHNDSDIIDEVEERTELDRGQCEALVAALTREFAFIQGPPGTGKSYLGVALMKVLLGCQEEEDLGPILVVTYTNHALDQFLEHFTQIGVQKIIRMGGQSKSEALKGKNLKVVSQEERKTKSEGHGLWTNNKKLDESMDPIQEHCEKLRACIEPSWANIDKYLAEFYPLIHAQFSRVDEDGFQIVGQHPFDIWRLDRALASSDKSADLDIESLLAEAEENVNQVSAFNRDRLGNWWISNIRANITDDLFESVKELQEIRQEIVNIHEEVDRRVLERAQVIGATTTGLAGRISTLRHVSCKVLICEEAGEIMEPHMLSALIPSVEHVISIGDHQQLRPKIINFNLSLESSQGALFQLDRSQFERLSVGERGRKPFPVAQLNVQRRMRPDVSRLIRETIYPKLVDHESTKNLPDVVGVRENVYWLDHRNPEDGSQEDRSRSNQWEIYMTHALLRHIIRQGVYKSDDIAVLTPYTGQLQKLRAKFRRDFEVVLSDLDEDALDNEGFSEGDAVLEPARKKPLEKKQMSQLLRLATIDNFQGEEAKVIIVSLVRSNHRKDPGFLKTTNRTNVLLSRAQHGLYLIGNAETMSMAPMWNDVIGLLQEKGSIGTSFSLCCPRHTDTILYASTPDDFARNSPEGGCRLICGRPQDGCDHLCQARCHSEAMHLAFSCSMPCERLQSPCGHPCSKATCGEKCGVCMFKLDNVQLPCGHSNNGIPCSKLEDLDDIQCKTIVEREVPTCDHKVYTKCSETFDPAIFKCAQPCEKVLDCGHNCPGTCTTCNQKGKDGKSVVKHGVCPKLCGRGFPNCNHKCQGRCHGDSDCGSCPFSCQVRCSHSSSDCKLKCVAPCAPCVMKCNWYCKHKGACDMPCGAPCSRLPCNERCHKLLKCKHRCPGVCGDVCPSKEYCQVCCDDYKKEAEIELFELKKYRDLDLNKFPIVVLGCGHFFTAKNLDGHLGMSDVYFINNVSGEFVALKHFRQFASVIPCCPLCNQPIRQHLVNRYNRITNRANYEQTSRKFLLNELSTLQGIELKISKLEQDLHRCRGIVFGRLEAYQNQELPVPLKVEVEKLLKMSFDSSSRVVKSITSSRNHASDSARPMQMLKERIADHGRIFSGRKLPVEREDDAFMAFADARVTLGYRAAEFKITFVVLADALKVSRGLGAVGCLTPIQMPGGSLERFSISFFEMGKALIKDCEAANLPKIAVEAQIYFSKIARAFEVFCHASDIDLFTASTILAEAETLLATAKWLTENVPFKNAELFRAAVEETEKSLTKPWFEEGTPEETASIQQASPEVDAYSEEWYMCKMGHPFTLAETGSDDVLAKCPECGQHFAGLSRQIR